MGDRDSSTANPADGASPTHREAAPDVSLLIPVRDEIRHIERCLDSILSQEMGGLTWEILLVDGGSTDGTRDVILAKAAQRSDIRLIHNPAGTVSPALNIGLRAARGAIVVRMDAHSLYAPDYVRTCVEVLRETGASAVGGVQVPVPGAATRVAEAIAIAQKSAFGTGWGHHRRMGYTGPAQTLWLGAFYRTDAVRIGGFDETLFRSEDNDFYQRLRREGGRLWISAHIRARYVCRETLGSYFRQCFVTGSEVPRTMVRNPRAMAFRHLVPGLALVVCALLASASMFAGDPLDRLARVVLLACGVLYAVLVGGAAFARAYRTRWSLWFSLLLVFPSAHLGYGAGTLFGVRKVFRRARIDERA